MPERVVRIADNGNASACIVVPDHLKETGFLFSHYLEKSSTASFPVFLYHDTTSMDSFKIKIWIGTVKDLHNKGFHFDPPEEDGFVILFDNDKHILISGHSAIITEFGVYDFLERYIGIKWLFPGPDGEHIPSHWNIDIPMQNIHESPIFHSRQLSGLRGKEQHEWARRNRMYGTIQFHHNLRKLFPPEKYVELNPEFFPIQKGHRYLPGKEEKAGWQPCFSAPGIVEEAVKNICDYFSKNPDKNSFSLGVNDSRRKKGSGYCQCDKCLAQTSGNLNFLGFKDMSDLYFKWANAVVAGVLTKYPDKWFGCLAYNEVATPPSERSVHPRLIPYMPLDRMKWIDDSAEKMGKQLTDEWLTKARHIGWYDYIYGTPYMIPRVYFNHMKSYYEYGEKKRVYGMYAEAYPNWGEGPKLYVALKLQWNPQLDVNLLLKEWYQCAVGEDAAPYLEKYYRHWEHFWTNRVTESNWFDRGKHYLLHKNPTYIDVVQYEDIQYSKDLMQEVVNKTRTSIQKKRAEILFRAFEYYESSVLSYLGLVKGIREDGKKKEFYNNVNKKRHDLLKEFQNDPVLIHPSRFDRIEALIW